MYHSFLPTTLLNVPWFHICYFVYISIIWYLQFFWKILHRSHNQPFSWLGSLACSVHSLVTWTLVYVGIIASDEGGWAKWQWTKSGVSSGGRNSEGVIVVSGDMWRAYTHFAQMKVGFSSWLGCWHNSLCRCASACERWLLLKGKVVVVCTLCNCC